MEASRRSVPSSPSPRDMPFKTSLGGSFVQRYGAEQTLSHAKKRLALLVVLPTLAVLYITLAGGRSLGLGGGGGGGGDETSVDGEGRYVRSSLFMRRMSESIPRLAVMKQPREEQEKQREEEERDGKCDLDAFIRLRIEEEEEEDEQTRPKKDVVLLVSHARSGSTLAGTLFFGTTNMFYLDEPMREMKNGRGMEGVDQIVDMLSYCNMMAKLSNMKSRAPGFVRWQNGRYKLASIGNEKPAWMVYTREDHQPGGSEWERLRNKLEDMEEYCVEKAPNIVGAKEIRINTSAKPNTKHTSAPETEMESGSACTKDVISPIQYALARYENVRVIHLIRHPFEVFRSAGDLDKSTPTNFNLGFENLCESTENDAIPLTHSSTSSSSIASRYIIVKYQDLATNPLETVRRVHDFMGVMYLDDDDVDESISGGATSTTRATTTTAAVAQAINARFVEDAGAGVGDSFKSLQSNKATSVGKYGTKRDKVSCGACDENVESAVDASASCRRIVDSIGLTCCK